MKRISLPMMSVFLLIAIDFSFSSVYAKNPQKEKYTIYEVNRVSPLGTLKLRAWPSPKSRVKISLPHNAKDLVETGKQRTIDKSRWVQVKWQENTGWVNSYYLKKTGVLLHPPSGIALASNRSRNAKPAVSSQQTVGNASAEVPVVYAGAEDPVTQEPALQEESQGDRYDQTLDPDQASPVALSSKMAFTSSEQKESPRWVLDCVGISPKRWSIKMDVAHRNMFVKLANKSTFNVPITYRKWAPGGQVRMEIGGGKGRNVVDATLEKTQACNTGLNKTNYSYRVNAAVNRGQLLSGCCRPVKE